jgi:hypothetical protein
MSPDYDPALGARWKAAREARGLSVAAAARASGLPHGTVLRVERGCPRLRVTTYLPLLVLYDVSPVAIWTRP